MNKLVGQIAATLVSLASFVAFVWTLNGHLTGWQIFALALATVMSGVSIWLEVQQYLASRPKTMTTEREIRDYMFNWIKRGARVAVFSRSLGWAQDADIVDMLTSKARASELTLVMPTPVALSADLESHGAKAIYYGQSGYTLKSRFTVINLDRTDTAVAIGRSSNGRHLVSEFNAADDDPSFWLAQDLIEILSAQARATAPGTAADSGNSRTHLADGDGDA